MNSIILGSSSQPFGRIIFLSVCADKTSQTTNIIIQAKSWSFYSYRGNQISRNTGTSLLIKLYNIHLTRGIHLF